METEISTEQKILDAAEEVFIEEGFSGARMQQIADKAGINKAMLHYYFRSKDKLFELVFAYKMKQFMPRVESVLQNPNLSLLDKLDAFIDVYLDMLRRNPRLPMFILSTMNRNPELMKSANIQFGKWVIDIIAEELEKGTIKRVDPHQFMLTLIGMCIFPFVGRPVFSAVFELKKEAYEQILAERKQHVQAYTRFILEP